MSLYRLIPVITLVCAVSVTCAIPKKNHRNDLVTEDGKKYNVETSLKKVTRHGFGTGDEGGGATGSGGKLKNRDGDSMFTKMMPFMVIPFMISSAMTPVALVSLKFMMLQAAFVGKLAIVLLLINFFWRFNNRGGGVYSHNVHLGPHEHELALAHYGYNGGEEYGAYIHKRKRR